MTLDGFNSFCASLPATQKVVQWGGAHVWKVGGRIFAIASLWGDSNGDIRIGFKASDLAFEILTQQPDIQPSPYLGRYKWVQLQKPDALTQEDIRAYLAEAHKIVSSKLSKAVRKQLQLADSIKEMDPDI